MPRPAHLRTDPTSIDVALLAAPGVSASTLYGFHDALASTRRDWQLLHGGPEVQSPLVSRVISRDGRPFEGSNGVWITPHGSFADAPAPDVVCITDLLIDPNVSADAVYGPELDWIRGAYASGATIACACSGAVLLAATGLLDGCDATSHWAYCDVLARRHPTTRWRPERGLVVAGADGRLVMSGSGIAWHVLVLALIAKYAGPEDALRVARINLLDANSTSALAYASLTRGGHAADPLMARCQAWIAEHYEVASPVARMAEIAGIPERTFKRRFKLATGMSPLEYVHKLRLEEAKQLLESTDEPVEAVAEAVGYEDASFFGRLFRRHVALTPAQYRRRFAALSRQVRVIRR